jgi:DNA-binding NarL/FixJ family response regulator
MSAAGVPNFIVADDHPLVRQGVRMVLESEFPHSRVIEAGDLDAALLAIAAQPDAMLLIDLSMPGMDGVESLAALRQEFPLLQIAVLTGNAERQTIMDALNAGVNGYILKASPPEELLHAISIIRGGHVYLANVFGKPPNKEAAVAPPASDPEPISKPSLTPRQREVISQLMKGHSNKQIARDLNIGVGTVKIHLAAIFQTLGAQNRTEAVMILNRMKL